jgi:hypothetical protein
MGWRYIFLNLASDGNEWSASRPSCFTPGKKVRVGQESGWVPEPILTRRQREKSLPLLCTEFQSSSPQSIHSTIWATHLPNSCINKLKKRTTLTSPSHNLRVNCKDVSLYYDIIEITVSGSWFYVWKTVSVFHRNLMPPYSVIFYHVNGGSMFL